MISIEDHLRHLAELDAEELAGPFRTIASREWDGRANAAWHRAAEDAGCSWTDYAKRKIYIDALLAICQRHCDA